MDNSRIIKLLEHPELEAAARALPGCDELPFDINDTSEIVVFVWLFTDYYYGYVSSGYTITVERSGEEDMQWIRGKWR